MNAPAVDQANTQTAPACDPADTLLGLAFGRILIWPCPDCGQPYPCPCDLATAEAGRKNEPERRGMAAER